MKAPSLNAETARSSPRLEIVRQRKTPPELGWVVDVRWLTADSVLLAAGKAGVVELSLGPGDGDARVVLAGGNGKSDVWMAWHLGVSASHLATAGGLFEVAWKLRAGGTLKRDALFDFIVDMDLRGDQIFFLGTRRGEDGSYNPEGGLGWLASLGDLPELSQIHPARSGAGPGPFDACGPFGLGHARFFPDGHLVVVPGGEPGIFLYGPAGKLLHVWESEPLGLDIDCNLSMERRLLLARDPFARRAWVNQYDTVDEVLPLPSGPGLVVRTASPEGVHWRLILLDRQSAPTISKLPFASPSPSAHLKADLRGDRLVFLQYEDLLPDTPFLVHPRLTEMRWLE